MPVKMRFPASLSHLTGGQRLIEGNAGKIKECLDELELRFPGIKEAISNGHINVYVNGDNIKYLQGLETFLREGDEVNFIPALAGG